VGAGGRGAPPPPPSAVARRLSPARSTGSLRVRRGGGRPRRTRPRRLTPPEPRFRRVAGRTGAPEGGVCEPAPVPARPGTNHRPRRPRHGAPGQFRCVAGRTPWRGGAGGAPGAVQCGSVSKSATKASHGGISRGQKLRISTFLFACPGAIGAFVADLDNTAPPAPPRKAPPDQFAPRRQQHRQLHRPPPPSPPDRETTTPRDLTFCYASFPPLRLFALCYAPFSRTVEGGGA